MQVSRKRCAFAANLGTTIALFFYIIIAIYFIVRPRCPQHKKPTRLLHIIPDIDDVTHDLVKNTLPFHHVRHDDTRVPPNCGEAGRQTASRHPEWLDLSLKRVLSVEFVELSPLILGELSELHTSF
jgi:hypothetical protein